MIDAANFEPQGKPTVEQAKAVWESMGEAASARKVHKILVQRGFSISWRTISRWHECGWRPMNKQATKPLAERGEKRSSRTRSLKTIVAQEVAKLPPATVAEVDKIAMAGGLEAAIDGGALKEDDYARIEKRSKDLANKSAAQLIEEQEKVRTIMNIILMEEATRRAHIMVLIPKDTGSFMSDAHESSKGIPMQAPIEPVGSGEPMRNGDGAKVINGGSMPVNTTSSAIDDFLRENA